MIAKFLICCYYFIKIQNKISTSYRLDWYFNNWKYEHIRKAKKMKNLFHIILNFHFFLKEYQNYFHFYWIFITFFYEIAYFWRFFCTIFSWYLFLFCVCFIFKMFLAFHIKLCFLFNSDFLISFIICFSHSFFVHFLFVCHY